MVDETEKDEIIKEETTPAEFPGLDATPQEKKAYLDKTAKDLAQKNPKDFRVLLHNIMASSWVVTLLAIFSALLLGAILIIFADSDVHKTFENFLSTPGDFFVASWNVVSEAYGSMFSGSIVNFGADSFVGFIKPFTETLSRATPLIFSGLGLAIGFKASLFNIGGQGQIIMGALLSALIGFSLDLPSIILIPLCVIGSFLGGAIWGFIPGILKAKTNANEVIVTIMLNYVALNFIRWALVQPVYQKEGQNVPIAKPMNESAVLPKIFGSSFNTNLGFVLALVAVAVVWWILNRSYFGFRLQAVGLNPNAAANAGIKVQSILCWVMVLSGGLCSMAAASNVLVSGTGVSDGIASSYGFDAITVALLGRSNPVGTLFAAILFGALRAGGYTMQATTGTPIDVVQIIQSLVVMFIAAPPLIRSIYHLPKVDKSKIMKEIS